MRKIIIFNNYVSIHEALMNDFINYN